MICINKKSLKLIFSLFIFLIFTYFLLSNLNKYSRKARAFIIPTESPIKQADALTTVNITLSAIKIQVNKYEYYDSKAKKMIKLYDQSVNDSIIKISNLLTKHKPNLILFPEFTFEFQEEFRTLMGDGRTNELFLEKHGEEFLVYYKVDKKYIKIIKEVSYLAKKYRTDVILGTFPLEVENIFPEKINNNEKEKSYIFQESQKKLSKNYKGGSLLHIDKNGKIVGIKMKYYSKVIGDFSIIVNGKKINILPTICAEVYEDIYALELVKNKQANFNIVTHSFGDDGGGFMNMLARYIQNINLKSDPPYLDFNRLKEAYLFYYQKFFPHIRSDAIFLISGHGGDGAILNMNLTPLTIYEETDEYVVANARLDLP